MGKMDEHSVLMTCVVLYHLVHLTSTQSPLLNIPAGMLAATVSEREATQTLLADGLTCSGGKDNSTRVYLQSTHPNNPCGKCFALWPIDGTDNYSLWFTPSLGSLSYARASTYRLSLTCTDDVTPVVNTTHVVVEPNRAPKFDDPSDPYVPKQILGTKNKRAGDVIDKVHAKDTDKDAVLYSLTSQPDNGFFEIGYGSGKIHATKDLRLMCEEESARFFISAKDSYPEPGDNLVIDATFKGGNVRPVIDETKTEILVPEDTPMGGLILPLKLTDDTVFDTAIYKLRAEPERGLEYYELVQTGGKARIRTRTELDYEYEYLRTVTLYVDVTDGFCDAETYSVTVTIEDVNEPPVIVPTKIQRCLYEGFIEVDPGWKIIDPDLDENIKWTMDSGKFHIDQDSGIVYSTEEYDLDPDVTQQKHVMTAKVKDKEGRKATAQLVLTIKDKNDNAPYFLTRLYKVTASNCTKVGALLLKLNAKDDDSEFEGNDALVYNGTAGRDIAVLSTGHITLLRQCVPGTTETIQGFVSDQGTYPGPLSGVSATIEFTCNVCPEPVTNAPDTNSTTDAADDGNDADALALNLGWGIVAAILALLLAALLAYFIWRYCVRACKRWRKRRALRKKTKKQMRKEARRANKQEKKLSEAVDITLPPPPQLPPPEDEPTFFHFWKETYVDRDQRHTPQRDVVPASVEKDKVVEEQDKKEEEKEKEERKEERKKVEENYRQEVEKYHQEVNAIRTPPPPPPPKKKFCHIL